MTTYNENSFWNKIKTVFKSAGREVIEKALWLYYAAQDPKVPLAAKTTIYTALAYFILPVDLIPDFLPHLWQPLFDLLAAMSEAAQQKTAPILHKLLATEGQLQQKWQPLIEARQLSHLFV